MSTSLGPQKPIAQEDLGQQVCSQRKHLGLGVVILYFQFLQGVDLVLNNQIVKNNDDDDNNNNQSLISTTPSIFLILNHKLQFSPLSTMCAAREAGGDG